MPSSATRDDLLTLHPQADERVFVVPNGEVGAYYAVVELLE